MHLVLGSIVAIAWLCHGGQTQQAGAQQWPAGCVRTAGQAAGLQTTRSENVLPAWPGAAVHLSQLVALLSATSVGDRSSWG